MRAARITIVTFAACLCAGAAKAADCPPLHIVNTVKLEALNGGNAFAVPVAINGASAKMLLDTGGYMTQISQAEVKTLGLVELRSNGKLFDAYGHVSEGMVRVETLAFGQMQARNQAFLISANPDLETKRDVSGILSTDLFSDYDLDLDFAAGRLNYFSPEHCEGRVTYWPERPLAVVPMTLQKHQIIVPVTIDGQTVTAMIDTGASFTAMDADAAQRVFGLTLGAADTPLIKDDSDLPVYAHPFTKLSFEGITVINPKIGIIPNRMGVKDRYNTTVLGSHAQHVNDDVKLFDVIIGMNVLKQLHLYIAYKEGKLYVTPAGKGESVLFKTPGQ